MSSQPSPVVEAATPFVPTTTPTIERANRLISLRANPGFLDLIRISKEIVQEAADICADYPGWDPQQITVLKVRMQCAKEHHQRLMAKITDAIQAGVEDARVQAASSLSAATAEESVDRGDYVRQKVLESFAEQDMRSAGSY